MKKIYIQPQSTTIFLQCRMMVSASRFNNNEDTQSITPDNNEYNEGFAVKGYSSNDNFEEW